MYVRIIGILLFFVQSVLGSGLTASNAMTSGTKFDVPYISGRSMRIVVSTSSTASVLATMVAAGVTPSTKTVTVTSTSSQQVDYFSFGTDTSVSISSASAISIQTSILGACMTARSLPAEFRGTEYYIITSQPNGASARSFIYLVAKDSTQTADVTIAGGTTTFRGTNYNVAQTVSVTFTGQPLTAVLESAAELTGTKVEVPGKSVSVYAGNYQTTVGTGTLADDMIESFPPKITWGKRYILLPFTGSAKSFVTAFSTTAFSPTNARITPDITPTTVAGTSKYTLNGDTAYYLETDNPSMVVQFQESGSSGTQRPANIYIPPMVQYTSGHHFFVPADRTVNLGVAIEESYLDGLRMDGNQLKSSLTFRQVAGTTMMWAVGQVVSGRHTITHDSKATYSAQVYQYTPNGQCSEATHLGMKLLNYDQVWVIKHHTKITC